VFRARSELFRTANKAPADPKMFRPNAGVANRLRGKWIRLIEHSTSERQLP
jgi:hypothetical protein